MAAGPYTLKFCASEWAKGHVNKIWTVYVWCKYGKFWGSTTNITWNYGEDWPLIDIASDLWLLCWSPVVSHYPIMNHTLRIHNPTLLFPSHFPLFKNFISHYCHSSPTISISIPLFLYKFTITQLLSHYFISIPFFWSTLLVKTPPLGLTNLRTNEHWVLSAEWLSWLFGSSSSHLDLDYINFKVVLVSLIEKMDDVLPGTSTGDSETTSCVSH